MLGKLKLGIEVWLESPPIERGESYEPTDFDGRPLGIHRGIKLLGYARIARKWQLAVKGAIVKDTGEIVDVLEYPDRTNNLSEPRPAAPWPLMDASRQARSEAMALVPHLIALLKERVKSLLEAVDSAEKAVDAVAPTRRTSGKKETPDTGSWQMAPELLDAVADFVKHFELVFDIDWGTTHANICDSEFLISEQGTFIDPGVEDESNNWWNRGSLLDSYRRLKALLDDLGSGAAS
jgi:hypothetical protein